MLVICRSHRCSSRLLRSPGALTGVPERTRLWLSRRGVVVAEGRRMGGRLVLRSDRPLLAGRYLLAMSFGSGRRTVMRLLAVDLGRGHGVAA